MLFNNIICYFKKIKIMTINNLSLKRNSKAIQIQLNLTEKSVEKVNHAKENNIFYGVFPIIGDSMTCEDKSKSIPHGSKVLAVDTQIDLSKGLSNIWYEIPTRKTLLLTGTASNGNKFFVCKSISSVDAVQGYVLLESYNKSHESKLIPFSWIESIFEVIQIVE